MLGEIARRDRSGGAGAELEHVHTGEDAIVGPHLSDSARPPFFAGAHRGPREDHRGAREDLRLVLSEPRRAAADPDRAVRGLREEIGQLERRAELGQRDGREQLAFAQLGVQGDLARVVARREQDPALERLLVELAHRARREERGERAL